MGQCPSDCSGHGTCMTEPQLYCQCYFGYVGMDCNAKICPNDCSGHGYCASDGNCTCLPGYSGYDCSSGACPANCNENGVCIHSRCECNIGYQGKFLSSKEYSLLWFFFLPFKSFKSFSIFAFLPRSLQEMPVKTVSVAQNVCMENAYTMNVCATMTTKVAIVKCKRVTDLKHVITMVHVRFNIHAVVIKGTLVISVVNNFVQTIATTMVSV